MSLAHDISISCVRGASMPPTDHRAHCSCGWSSDCYAQLADTQRAIDVHLRSAQRVDFEDLIARSSIGAAIADVKVRGLDAHLVDLECEMNRRRPTKKKSAEKKLSTEDAAFMRGFGAAIASIWRCHHDGQMVRHVLKENNFQRDAFRGVGLLDGDWRAICQAVRR